MKLTRVATSGTERYEQLKKLALGAHGLAYNCRTGEDKNGRCDNVQCDLCHALEYALGISKFTFCMREDGCAEFLDALAYLVNPPTDGKKKG